MINRYLGVKSLELPKQGSWPASRHIFEEGHAYALAAAEAAGRPLLLRGEPGTGKSQLARAAAVATGRLFLSVVVNARTECEDLLWKFDAVARLGEAQILASVPDGERLERLKPARFLSPGPLWWALSWQSAADQYRDCGNPSDPPPETPQGWTPAHGSVLLIDEIDKADTDLANSLLETMGNSDFKPPYLNRTVRGDCSAPPPLVVITTNEDRELPLAFVRRCLVLPLSLPEDPQQLIEFLQQRGKAHFPDLSDGVRLKAAELLQEDRAAAEAGQPRAGQAEYLDLLRALTNMARQDAEQMQLLERLRGFVYRKNAS